MRPAELDNNNENATKCNRMQHFSKFSSGHAAIVACSAAPISEAAAGMPEGAAEWDTIESESVATLSLSEA